MAPPFTAHTDTKAALCGTIHGEKGSTRLATKPEECGSSTSAVDRGAKPGVRAKQKLQFVVKAVGDETMVGSSRVLEGIVG